MAPDPKDRVIRKLEEIVKLEEKYAVTDISFALDETANEDITTRECVDYVAQVIVKSAKTVARHDLYRPGCRPPV